MKKLGLVVGSLVLATIGGVYANWVYLGNTNVSLTHGVGTFGMADVIQDSGATVGMYTAGGNIKDFTIDQKAADNYTAVLKTNYEDESDTSPEITITFTAKTGAANDIVENGIQTYLYFGFASMPTYDDPTTDAVETDEIFSVVYDASNYITIGRVDDTSAKYKWSKTGTAGVLEVQINDLALADIISLNTFVLDSIEKNRAFEAALDEFNMYVTSSIPNV